MHSNALSVDDYIASLPGDRQEAIAALRAVIRKHLPKGYKEGMQYGMICYYIPMEEYPDTYNGKPLSYAALASQKNYLSLYLMGVYSEPDESWLRDAFAKAGKKLDMGKSCIHFKKVDDLPLNVIAQAIAMYPPKQFIEIYEKNRQ